jgi:hypothetical protein
MLDFVLHPYFAWLSLRASWLHYELEAANWWSRSIKRRYTALAAEYQRTKEQ